jgi:phage baseplate assembly protein W
MQKNIYRGYNSWEFEKTKSFKLNDIDLVKSDLLNHIFTRKGERVMMPNWGTQIPEMVFEPLNEDTVDVVYDELEYVFNYDPRVEIQKLKVTPNYTTNSIQANAQLWYIELNISNNLELNIEFGG